MRLKSRVIFWKLTTFRRNISPFPFVFEENGVETGGKQRNFVKRETASSTETSIYGVI
jgi:hypothetical protein